MSVQTYISKSKRGIFPSITPRIVGWFFLILTVVLVSVLFQPIAEVFSGKWILQSEFQIFDLNSIKLNNPSLASNPILEILSNIGLSQLNIRYYAITMLVGVLSGFFLTLFLASRHYIAETLIDRLFIGILIIGLIGARILFILVNNSLFKEPLDYINLQKGGLAIFGGLIAGTIYTWYYCSKYKFNKYEFGDFLAPGVLLGQIIGRFGNFFNYEAYGAPTRVNWKMYVPESVVTNNRDTQYFNISNSERFYHPAFLYEIIPNTFLLLIILFNYERMTERKAGIVLATYMVGYGLIRFFTEFQRLDALRITLPANIQFVLFGWTIEAIYVTQLLALSLFVAGIYVFYTRRKVIFNKRELNEVN